MHQSDKFVFTIPGRPCSDTRPRASRGRIYDPRSKEKKVIKALLKETVAGTGYVMPKKYDSQKDTKQKRIHDVFYLDITVNTYIQQPKNFSKYIKNLADQGLVRPGGRPDIDNYIKLYLDVSHDILFEDDSIVVSVSGNKYYAQDYEHVDIIVKRIEIPKQ